MKNEELITAKFLWLLCCDPKSLYPHLLCPLPSDQLYYFMFLCLCVAFSALKVISNPAWASSSFMDQPQVSVHQLQFPVHFLVLLPSQNSLVFPRATIPEINSHRHPLSGFSGKDLKGSLLSPVCISKASFHCERLEARACTLKESVQPSVVKTEKLENLRY
jgi:hypothetical protein